MNNAPKSADSSHGVRLPKNVAGDPVYYTEEFEKAVAGLCNNSWLCHPRLVRVPSIAILLIVRST